MVYVKIGKHHHQTTAMAARSNFLKAVVLVLCFLQYVLAHQQMHLSSEAEWLALLDLRSSLGVRGKYWPLKDEPCSSWKGIQCLNGRVVGISLSGLKRTRSGRRRPRLAVDSLANLTLLASFNASGFLLRGFIPDWFGQRLVALEILDLRSCSVIGAIPESLGNLNKLNYLYLSGNSLTGSVPSQMGQLSSLAVLDLSQNSLTGTIPSSFSSLANLTRLELSSNFFSGSIPPGLGLLSKLQSLNLSDNSLVETIPVQLGNLSQLVELDISKNLLSGSLPLELRGLGNLQKMYIGNNELEGRLPSSLFSSLSQLQVVVLSGNKFDGSLPSTLWSAPNLRFLDVSSNNFTGTLSLGNSTGVVFNLSNNLFYGVLISSLKEFDVIDLSSNYFMGEAPGYSLNNANLTGNCLQKAQEQRRLVDCRQFYVQRGLPFNGSGVPDPVLSPFPEPESRSNRRLVFVLAGTFGGLGFIIVVVVVLVIIVKKFDKGVANQRGTANVRPVPEGDNPTKDPTLVSGMAESFTYEKILQSTCNFSDTNLIKHGHSGDLFLGYLESGIPLVIKKVDVQIFRKESYVIELEILSKIQHSRLVPLLGHCLEHESEKFLIYKYMPNGDLANSLHKISNSADNKLQCLDWITRLKIATGAAEALSYLHHECSPPLVHRDVQASSILLDDKFEVRLGSLSEIRPQEGDSHQNVVARFLRKPQNSDPGTPGSSSTSYAYDVYCFGKVLLELITGKLGVSRSDDAATREWLEHTLSQISIYDKELVNKIVDPYLIIDDDLLEEVWAMAIVARSCLNPKPSRRPFMRHILKALENPLKVVREENSSSVRLRTTSSRRSWSAAFFGSWRQSSSESAAVLGQTIREGTSGSKQSGRVGSHNSGGQELSYSDKRLSNEIFPEPIEMQDIESSGEK